MWASTKFLFLFSYPRVQVISHSFEIYCFTENIEAKNILCHPSFCYLLCIQCCWNYAISTSCHLHFLSSSNCCSSETVNYYQIFFSFWDSCMLWTLSSFAFFSFQFQLLDALHFWLFLFFVTNDRKLMYEHDQKLMYFPSISFQVQHDGNNQIATRWLVWFCKVWTIYRLLVFYV